MHDDVSRETPLTPLAARGVFRDRLDLAEQYADLLTTEGVVRGLIGPREAPRIWDRHLLNCAVVADALPQALDVCDVGSGAGLPGVVLAIRRPDLSLTLVEPLLRRSTFLLEVVEHLGLVNVEVIRARAEELHDRRRFSVVTARAVAPLDRLLTWCWPLVGEGGSLLAIKGSSAQREIEDARERLATLGAGIAGVEEYGAGIVDPPVTVVRVAVDERARLGWDSRRAGSTREPRSRSKRGRRGRRG